MKKNTLRETIESVLDDITIESGRRDEFEKVVLSLESAISKKIVNHEIDYYTEIDKHE